jgi:hypothetical protein
LLPAGDDDEIDVAANQVSGELRGTVRESFIHPILYEDVLTLDVSGLSKSFAESGMKWRHQTGSEVTDPGHSRRSLRLGGERRGEHTGQRGQQEAAPVHHSMI